MAEACSSHRTFGLLPDPESRPGSFITSVAINLSILLIVVYIGMATKRVLIQNKFEATLLIAPTQPPKPIQVKSPVVHIEPDPAPRVKLDAPKIEIPRVEHNPEPKPIQMEARFEAPAFKEQKTNVFLAPQPKAALAAAEQTVVSQLRPSTSPVHFGDVFGVTPNPNASRPAAIAAIGNPYGGMYGRAIASKGAVRSTGVGDGTAKGASYGNGVGKVASVGILAAEATARVIPIRTAQPVASTLEILSKPPVQYTAEARRLHIEGDVVLRVTFMASGQAVVREVIHGLGHGLDEEARRIAEQIRFRPVVLNGKPSDTTTNITITFQLT